MRPTRFDVYVNGEFDRRILDSLYCQIYVENLRKDNPEWIVEIEEN